MGMLSFGQLVSAKDIFVSKPLLRYVFPAPTGVTEYEGHVGPITMISMSPFHRRVFLSVGVDGYAKLWSTMQRRALMTMRDTSCIHLADGLFIRLVQGTSSCLCGCG